MLTDESSKDYSLGSRRVTVSGTPYRVMTYTLQDGSTRVVRLYACIYKGEMRLKADSEFVDAPDEAKQAVQLWIQKEGRDHIEDKKSGRFIPHEYTQQPFTEGLKGLSTYPMQGHLSDTSYRGGIDLGLSSFRGYSHYI